MSIEMTTMLEEAAMENWHRNSEGASPRCTAHSPSAQLMAREDITHGLSISDFVLGATSGFPLKY